MRSWLLPTLMVAITAIAASTAMRIEWYNHAVGGFLPRPQPPSMEGNEIKWRATGPRMVEWHYRSRIAYDRGLELDLVDDKEALFAIPLTTSQQIEVDEMKRHAELNTEFLALVQSMGLLQYALVPVGLFLSIKVRRYKPLLWRSLGGLCLLINIAAGGLMLYRQYMPALGW